MEKEEVVKILQATLLLFDDMPESEVEKSVDSFSVTCAKYLVGFLKTYKK